VIISRTFGHSGVGLFDAGPFIHSTNDSGGCDYHFGGFLDRMARNSAHVERKK